MKADKSHLPFSPAGGSSKEVVEESPLVLPGQVLAAPGCAVGK